MAYLSEQLMALLFISQIFIVLGSGSAWSVCKDHKTVFSTVLHGTIGDGPLDYESNQRCEWLISSPDLDKYPFVTLEFLSKMTECAYDYITIFDGDSHDSPQLATLSGSWTAQDPRYKILARSGKMLVYLFSDKNTEFAGFNASFTISECPNNCTGNGLCLNNRCLCYASWTGTDCSQRPCPHNCGGREHGFCMTATELKKCHCNDGFIGKGCRLKVNSGEKGGHWVVVFDYLDGVGSVGRAGHTALYSNSYYYIFGGYNMKSEVAEFLRFDFVANEWVSLHSPTQPTARFFHSMTAVSDDNNSTHFLLFGGDLGDDRLSNETWMYGTQYNFWQMHVPSTVHHAVPAVCQHSATLVKFGGDQFVYVFGGRMESSQEYGLSSDMYRFEWTKRRWKKIVYDPSGVKYSKLRVAGHTVVYDAVDETLVLFGGFRMTPLHKVVSSSTVFLYSVKDNRWAEIVASDEPGPFSYNIEPRAFHSANVVGDYMVVHGGHLRNPTHGRPLSNHNLCYSSQTHFYNLRSHAWVKELREFSEAAPVRLYGHTAAVMNDAVLLLHGGYTGVMSRQLLAYKLPNLMTVESAEVAHEKCANHEDEASCGADYLHGCVWIKQECRNGVNEPPIYGGVCQYLKNCLSCATFRSYVRNSSYGWNSSNCGWCVQDSTCYPVYSGAKLGACASDGEIYQQNPWWDVSDIKLLQNPQRCLLENKQPGIIAEEYRHFANFSQPDNVSFLTRVHMDFKEEDLFGDYLVRLRGFLRPNNLKGSYMKMLLLSVKGKSKILLSSNNSPKDLKVILNSPGRYDSNIPSESKSIDLRNLREDRYFIDISFNHTDTGHWNGKLQAELATSDGDGDFKFSMLSAAHLEPYQGSLVTDSLLVQSCDTFTNCLACLMDESCAWCDIDSVCVSKSTLADGLISCTQQDDTVSFPHAGMITEPASCVVCQDYSTCHECVTSNGYCEWRGNENAKVKCVRRGSAGKNATSNTDHCPSPCHHRKDCESCLQGVNEHGISQRCAWCSTTRKCYILSRYHLTAYPFGQCAFWVDEVNHCPSCSVHKGCKTCLQTYECGWCSVASNPLLGYCTRGGFGNPTVKCDASYLEPEYQNASSYQILWSYEKCPDINECVLQEWPVGNLLHSCHANAMCHNTDGSYFCICNEGYKGDGDYCERTCVTECRHGRCSGYPDYACICDLGWTSLPNANKENEVECNINCNCNFLSTCISGQGMCDSCQQNTTGRSCGQCLPGYYHINQTGTGCQPCQCNGHGISSLDFCDQMTGDCFCRHNTRGKHCDSCEVGYFGNPRNGGVCYHKCEGRLKMEERTGAFGSWESSIRQDGSVLRRKIENMDSLSTSRVDCLWTIFVKNYTNEDGALAITVENDINLPCYKNNVFVYDGAIGFGETELLGEFCGSNWEKSEIFYAQSGEATIQFTNVYLDGQPQKYGFSARYELQPNCSKTFPSSDEDVISRQSDSHNDGTNVDYMSQNSGRLPDWGCQVSVPSGCFNNCSSKLSQGLCKMGLCHCFSNFTGFDCSVDANDIASLVNLQMEWNEKFSKGSSPGKRIGHVLIGIGSSLWLYGGISQNGKISDDLWRYDIGKREWILQDIPVSRPSGRYFHAASRFLFGKEFYVYGGNVHGGNSSSDLWIYSTDGVWQKIVTDAALPSLAGQTLTFCGGAVAYVIGGYSSVSGFNDIIWTFDSESNNVSSIPKSIIHPPLLYGHSTVCDQDSGILYVYGGMEASFLQLPSPTNGAYLMDTKKRSWRPLVSKGQETISPLPRAFHSAMNFYSENTRGMLMLGGRLESSQTSDEIWFLDYNCSSWKRLISNVKELNSTLIEGIPAYASMASDSQDYYIYGGFRRGNFPAEMIVVSSLHLEADKDEQTQESCTSPGNKPSCFLHRNCQSCLESDICYWCQSSFNPLEGECISPNRACSVGQDLVVEKQKCDACFSLSLVDCHARQGCSWEYMEVMDDYHDKLLRSCFCRKDSNVKYASTTTPMRPEGMWQTNSVMCENYHHKCPGSCSVHKSCGACLKFPDSSGVWWHCVWSPGLEKCMDPSYVPIACPPGGNCGTLAGKGMVSCPVSSCDQLPSCWKCIHEARCYWLETDSSGKCLDISPHEESESSGVEFYYECPLEDECASNFDDCLEDEVHHERCHDLTQGYECVCESGFNRSSPLKPCLPVCTQGCFSGKCIQPDVCVCNFGYAGVDCNTPCKCNGHSNCQDASNPDVCLQCGNNTIGNQCESCKIGYAGNPLKNISCEKCKDVCNGKSDICLSKLKSTIRHGPTLDDVVCIDCRDHSHGDRCDRCKEGYFKLNGECRKCECNGHSDTCDGETGGFCKCQNHTMSSDERCFGPKNSDDPYPGDCWKKQCDKCKASYQGNPKYGGHCYRHVTIEHNMCFSAQNPTHCPSVDYGGSADSFLHHMLPAGQTVTFALNPKYTNVDIRITVDVTYGKLSLFLSDEPDAFKIIAESSLYFHKVIPNVKIVNERRHSRDLSQQDDSVVSIRSQLDKIVRKKKSVDVDYWIKTDEEPAYIRKLELDVVNASSFNSYVTLPPYTALRIDGIRNRLVVTIPHTGFDLKLKKFYVILLGRQAVEPVVVVGSKDYQNGIDMTAGQLVFRQDQTHIDLFVFFSVFFSCFFLFLAICIVAWKIKQFMDQREQEQTQLIAMQQMASRPFAKVCVSLDSILPDPLFYCTRNQTPLIHAVANNDLTAKLFQARSCPVFVNDEGACTSRSSASGPNSLSLPNSPSHRQLGKPDASRIPSRRVMTTHLSLVMSGSHSSNGEPISPVKSLSQGTNYSCDSTDQLLVIHGNADIPGAKIPLLNSTTTYINREPEIDNIGQLTPLSSCGSRTPSPFRPGNHSPSSRTAVMTTVSVDDHGRIRTCGRRKTLSPGMNKREDSSDGIFEPRTGYCSIPNLPETRPLASVGRVLSKNPQLNKSLATPGNIFKNLSHTKVGKSEFSVEFVARTAMRPLSCEMTDNGFASVNTVLLQLPGGSKAPVIASLGSALVATGNTCESSLADPYDCKHQFKSRSCKLS